MYKLVTLDMDGTLLDSYGNVSLENKEAIKKAIRKRNRSCTLQRQNIKFYGNNCKRNWS